MIGISRGPVGLAVHVPKVWNNPANKRATQLGNRLKSHLTSMRESVPHIAEIRGPGAMIAAEFFEPGTLIPDADFAKRFQARALELGLILLVCGVHSNVIRFLFPLTIEEAVFEEALVLIETAMKDAAAA